MTGHKVMPKYLAWSIQNHPPYLTHWSDTQTVKAT